MKPIIVLGLSLLLTGCANLTPRSARNFQVIPEDYGSLAEASLKLIERTGPITTIVVPPGTDPQVRAALARLRPVVAADKMPKSDIYALPAGYLLLQSFTIEDGAAMFEGRVGPVRKVPLPPATADCGTNFAIPFALEGTDWASHTLKKSVCWPKREWWPKDEERPAVKGNP